MLTGSEDWVKLCETIQDTVKDVEKFKSQVAKFRSQVLTLTEAVDDEDLTIAVLKEEIQSKKKKLPVAEVRAHLKIEDTIYQMQDALSEAEAARTKAVDARDKVQAKLGVAEASRRKVEKQLAHLLESRENLKYDPPD